MEQVFSNNQGRQWGKLLQTGITVNPQLKLSLSAFQLCLIPTLCLVRDQLELDGQHPTSREMTKIRELLQEEQNFEIINYPTPPQYSVSKRGNKKVRYYINKQYLLF